MVMLLERVRHFKPASIPLSSAWYGDISLVCPSEGPAPSHAQLTLLIILVDRLIVIDFVRYLASTGE